MSNLGSTFFRRKEPGELEQWSSQNVKECHRATFNSVGESGLNCNGGSLSFSWD